MQFINYKLGGAAAAGQFFNIVTGEATITSGSNSVTVTFASKTLAKTFFFHTWEIDAAVPYPGEVMVMGEPVGAGPTFTQITFSTWANVSGDCKIRYYIFEGQPSNPINVQHGKVSWTGQSVQFPTISAVVLANSFVISSHAMQGNTMGSDDPTLVRLPTTTQVELRKNAVKVNGTSAYQVIENSRWTVSETSFQITSGTSTTTVGLTGGHTFPANQSFMIGTGRVTTTPIPGNEFPRVSFASTTQAKGDTDANVTNTWDITVFAVDTAGDISVQTPSLTIPASANSATAAITAIPSTRAAICSGALLASNPGHNNASANGDETCDKADFSSTTLIRATRNSTAGQAQVQSLFALQAN